MFATMPAWLRPPVFADEDKTRVAGLLNLVLWVLLLILPVRAAIQAFTAPRNAAQALPIFIVLAAGDLALNWLMRRGHVRLAGILLTLLVWGAMTAANATFGGVQATLFPAYGVAILLAGLLLGGWSALGFGIASILAGAALWTLGMRGLLPPAPPDARTLDALFANLAPTFASIAVLAMLFDRGYSETLRRAKQDRAALAAGNRELLDARAALERRSEQLRAAVERYDRFLAEVGSGHLAGRLALAETAAHDPLAALGHRINDTAARLEGMTAQTRETAGVLGTVAAEILTAMSEQVSNAAEQSAAIGQTMATVEEVRAIAAQATVQAQSVAQGTQRTVDVSRAGQQAVGAAIASVGQIKTRVESIAENILALSAQTQQIGDIVATVNDLAAQSNMLALNAAVEAARAGEQGKGFAVVAAEVRRLAEQSRHATAQITTILTHIQQATNSTVMATEEGTKDADEGTRLAAAAAGAIEQLAAAIDLSSREAAQMAARGQQQSAGIEQIAAAIHAIHAASTQSLAATRQAETAAQTLNRVAGKLAQTEDARGGE